MGFFSKLFGGGGDGKKASAKRPTKPEPPKPSGPPKRAPLKRLNLEKRFKLHNRVGQGSMSKVWRATDTETGRTVVIKVLDTPKTAALKKRFVGLKRPDEGEIAVTLDHPNVVKTFEYGTTNQKEEFLVMEFVDGVGFNVLVETRAKQLMGNELDYLIQMAEGIEYFHRSGYIHRDICPRNAMVTTEGVVKLIDFGLAVPNTPDFRKPGNRTGTANYMAPELIKRQPTDPRIDVFSFGVTAFETFTGTLPWESAQSLEAMLKHVNQPGRDPREARADLPEGIVKVIQKGIERDREKRFQTMREFIDAMKMQRRILKGEGAEQV